MQGNQNLVPFPKRPTLEQRHHPRRFKRGEEQLLKNQQPFGDEQTGILTLYEMCAASYAAVAKLKAHGIGRVCVLGISTHSRKLIIEIAYFSPLDLLPGACVIGRGPTGHTQILQWPVNAICELVWKRPVSQGALPATQTGEPS